MENKFKIKMYFVLQKDLYMEELKSTLMEYSSVIEVMAESRFLLFFLFFGYFSLFIRPSATRFSIC